MSTINVNIDPYYVQVFYDGYKFNNGAMAYFGGSMPIGGVIELRTVCACVTDGRSRGF